MSFVLGFYVSLVVKRWWEQYKLLPWPDTLALFLNAGIPGGVSTYYVSFIYILTHINMYVLDSRSYNYIFYCVLLYSILTIKLRIEK